MIWRLRTRSEYRGKPTIDTVYGCPVEVYHPAVGRVQVCYVFPGRCLIWPSTGNWICSIPAECTGYPQERAQQAIDQAVLIPWDAVRSGRVLNPVPVSVGVMNGH